MKWWLLTSDFMNEPLNFHNYINDISMFGADSYVLDVQNESVFRELMSYSLLVYGHKNIHSIVYERLTAGDIDYIIQSHNRLGQVWNSFYRCELFSKGGIESVLKEFTLDAYSCLDIKFQQGLHRYIQSNVSKSAGVGIWIDSVFGLNNVRLQIKDTLAEIVADTELMNQLVTNESILLILSFNAAIMSIDMKNEVFAQLLNTIVASTQATLDLVQAINNEGKLAQLFANQSAMSVLVNSEPSMQGIVQNSIAFQALLDSSIGMSMVNTSSIARGVIVTAMTEALTANQSYEASKDAVDLLSQSHVDLVGGSTATDIIRETQEQIYKAVEVLTSILNTSNVMYGNTKRILDHSGSMKTMLQSKEFLKLIFANSITKIAFLKTIEADATLKSLYLDSLDKSGFYTKSKLIKKEWTPVYDSGSDSYIVDGTVTTSDNAVIRMSRLYAYDPTTDDNGGTGPYSIYADYILRSKGTVKGYKLTETDIALDHICHSFRYKSSVTGLIPTDCIQRIEYYKYTLD